MTHAYRNWEGGGVASVVKEVRTEVERVGKAAAGLGLLLPLTVDLGLVVRPAEYGAGLVFQLSHRLPVPLPPKREHGEEGMMQEGKRGRGRREEGVVAAGGRYDELVERMRKPVMEAQPPAPVVAAGLSLSLGPFVALATRRVTVSRLNSPFPVRAKCEDSGGGAEPWGA